MNKVAPEPTSEEVFQILNWLALNSWIDFFTDGSCWDPGDQALALASWAAVSASHGQVLTSGPLTGLQQDINRAELTAACAVLAWTMENGTKSTLWTDSTYVSLGIHSLLEGSD